MTLHNVKTFKASVASAIAAALMLTSVTSFAAPLPEKDFVTQPVGHGVYELAYDGQAKVLFAASAPSFDKDKTQGKIYKLDLEDLTGTGVIETSRRAFATALDEENHLLYVGNTLEGSVTLIDTRTGKELAVIQLADTSNPKEIAHTREMVLDKQRHRLYVSGVVEKGIVWVVDTEKRQLITTLTNMGEYPTGLALDAQKNRLYVVNGRNELIAVDTTTDKIVSRFTVEPEKKHFFLNIALDSKNNRAFLTDPDLPQVLVVDINTGRVLDHIDVTNSLAVLYNEKRSEVYVTHRNAKLISIIDSKTYQLKNSIATNAMPNSLALSSDSNVLYASIKQDEKVAKDRPDYVLKITLDKL
ncbi:YncE family protein [Lelliottia sp. CFBP8978]|uniref:7-bladed beta-propeller protein YncE n=1 Tax=Lelliottia sp. CFBP8978 TaxID=3096522 RepID=UPI002A6B63D0|nr:YncE family protein [Lelliottia sp. CFBP8978]MDY1037727.1 YncE family protein [Lelliottia sp. CFBP8978]